MTPVPAVALIAAAAWVVLVGEAPATGPSGVLGHLCGIAGSPLADFAGFLFHWPVMVAAMMLPDLAFDMRRRSASNSAALVLFLTGFFAVWEIFGFAAFVAGGIAQSALAAAGLHSGRGDAGGAALLCLVAVAIFASARSVSHRPASSLDRAPLVTIGFRSGLDSGTESLRCCWSIMALMMAAKLHDPLSVAAFTLFVAYLRRGRFGIPVARLVGVAALADAVVALTLRTSLL
jgi:predicted metal-binding membrane protein